MPRALDLRLKPSDNDGGLEISAYTYAYDSHIASRSMRESVYIDLEVGPARVYACMTPAEARTLAQHLLRVADVADEHRQRRESLDEIEEQLRDADFDHRVVHFCHPDVVYAEPGEMEAVAARNPGKVVISRCEQGGIGLSNGAGVAQGVACWPDGLPFASVNAPASAPLPPAPAGRPEWDGVERLGPWLADQQAPAAALPGPPHQPPQQ